MWRKQHRADRDHRRHNGGDEARCSGISGSHDGSGTGSGGIVRGFDDQPGIRRGARSIPGGWRDIGGSDSARRILRRDGGAGERLLDKARDDPSTLLNGGRRAGRRAADVRRTRPHQ
jgi:hypothetical protein